MVLIGFANVTDDNVRLLTNSHGRRRYRTPRDFGSALGPCPWAWLRSVCREKSHLSAAGCGHCGLSRYRAWLARYSPFNTHLQVFRSTPTASLTPSHRVAATAGSHYTSTHAADAHGHLPPLPPCSLPASLLCTDRMSPHPLAGECKESNSRRQAARGRTTMTLSKMHPNNKPHRGSLQARVGFL